MVSQVGRDREDREKISADMDNQNFLSNSKAQSIVFWKVILLVR
jgi:hypothetical protein